MAETDRTITEFDRWLGLLKAKLLSLGYIKSLAFAASCCERSVPNYQAFSREQHWGDPEILIKSLDLLWRIVMTKSAVKPDPQIRELLQNLGAATPDTENFKSKLTSAALDAANSLAEALDYARDQAVDHILTIVILARDTISLFLYCNGYGVHSDQNTIADHPMMLAELAKQQADVSALESAHDSSPEFFERFRRNATIASRGSLGIGLSG